jgi:hypothetical protein
MRELTLQKRRWISLGLLFALPLWLHSYEAAFWRLHLGWQLFQWLGISLGIVSWLRVLRRARASELRWLGGAVGFWIAVGLLSTATFCVADGDQRHWPIEDISALSLGYQELAVVPVGVEVLQCSPELVVFGRARGNVERFVSTTSADSPLLLTPGLIPADFEAYAQLVEPGLRAQNAEQRRYVVAEDFLRWQFPRHIMLVMVPEANATERRVAWGCTQVPTTGTVITLEEDNRTGSDGVYPTDPLLGEAVRGGFSGRLASYGNLLRYAFIGPHDRRDLVDDPYFALIRHSSLDCRGLGDSLPPPRRAFLRRRMHCP